MTLVNKKDGTTRRLRSLYLYCLEHERPYILSGLPQAVHDSFRIVPSPETAERILVVMGEGQDPPPEVTERFPAGIPVSRADLLYFPDSVINALAANLPRRARDAAANDPRDRGRGYCR